MELARKQILQGIPLIFYKFFVILIKDFAFVQKKKNSDSIAYFFTLFWFLAQLRSLLALYLFTKNAVNPNVKAK